MSGSATPESEFTPGVPRGAVALDIAERLLVVGLFAQFAWHAISNFVATSQIISLMMVLSETLPIAFVLFRRPARKLSVLLLDWVVGIAGTMMPLLVIPTTTTHALIPVTVCLLIMIVGIYLEVAAKLILGRSFGIIAANRGVRTRGPYRVIRHPMYAGYLLTHIGILLAMPSWRNAALYSVALTFQLWRMDREEAVLKQDADYRDFARQVRFRLVPEIF